MRDEIAGQAAGEGVPAAGDRCVISVVMSVHNGEADVSATVASVLAQTYSAFEFIIVDDGSTDRTGEILTDLARSDARIRILTQHNAGLTQALIRGCREARGPLIARQDCGDRSHPERFAKQLLAFSEDDVTLVSCFTRYVGPGGETLYFAAEDGEKVRKSLLNDDLKRIRGLSHHGSAMFRREAYATAGGYRSAFRFAQDLDLWMRMARLGRIIFVPEVLYEAKVDARAISGRNRAEQIASTRIALKLRDSDQQEALLAEAAAIVPSAGRSLRRAEARALYFIASCLRQRRDRRWVEYARRALRRNPLLVRAWLLFVRRAP